ncbi:hypothetical protein [Cohnella terricola]|uniref:Lipoprotein n=1 Tax=Cohnella terricola TaxID=1289167 RepID=A0A559JB91_9BACL|nr:hypothetical protein [Cohnella terricola]TVX97148.1 hypothetical protein FPZ45_19575 [Cohnella terricola]
MRKRLWMCFMQAAVLSAFMVACNNVIEDENLPLKAASKQIINNSKYLSAEQAEVVYQDIVGLLLSTYPQKSDRVENVSLLFSDYHIEGSVISVDVTADADLTSITAPEDRPVIIGMSKALSEANDEKLGEAGKQMIEGYLKEMEPYYNKTDRSSFPLRLTFDKDNKKNFNYELFYLLTVSGQTTMHPAKAYFEQHFEENSEEKEQLGYDMMKEELAASAGER